jgi:hypothetical protein
VSQPPRQTKLLIALFCAALTVTLVYRTVSSFLKPSTPTAEQDESSASSDSKDDSRERSASAFSVPVGAANTPLSAAQTHQTSPSFNRFQSLIDRSKEEQEQCVAQLKRLSQDLDRGENPDWSAIRKAFAETLLEPGSTSAAIGLAEGPDAKSWDQPALFSSIREVGNCEPMERKQLIAKMISRLSELPEDSEDRKLGIESLLKNFSDSARLRTPLMLQLLQISLLEQMGTSGLLGDEYAPLLEELKYQSDTTRMRFQTELYSLSDQNEHRKALEVEFSASDRLREKIQQILGEIRG